MPDIQFSVLLLSSMLALCASYAFTMSVLQKELSKSWLRGESLLMLVALGTALSAGFSALTGEHGALYSVNAALLAFGLAIAFCLSAYIQFKFHPEFLSDGAKKKLLVASISQFCVLLLSVFTLFAATSGIL